MPGVKTIVNIEVKCACGTDITNNSTVEYSPTGKVTMIVPTTCKKCCSRIFNEGRQRGFDEGYLEGKSST